jgi:adenine-specific DNA-methyltransferase
LGDNVKIDDAGRVIKVGAISKPGADGGTYDVMHPVTGIAVPVPKGGWRWSRSRMQQEISKGGVLFGRDHTYGVRTSKPLIEMNLQTVKPSFKADRRFGSNHLQNILGDKRFPFPKNHDVLMKWFRIIARRMRSSLTFAGSGTNAESVIRLNEEDGGTRQAILITNNELAKSEDADLRKKGFRPVIPVRGYGSVPL